MRRPGSKSVTLAEQRAWRKLTSRGGKTAAKNMTPAERKRRAQKAARARWGVKASRREYL